MKSIMKWICVGNYPTWLVPRISAANNMDSLKNRQKERDLWNMRSS